MKPKRWQELDQLFHAALERAPEKRAAFLDKVCAGDESLRKQAEDLLTGGTVGTAALIGAGRLLRTGGRGAVDL